MKGQSEVQIKGVEEIVNQFTDRMEKALATDFTKLGSVLNKACQEQVIYAENYKKMEQTAQTLLQSNRELQKTLENTMDRQVQLEKDLKIQGQRIEETSNLINEEISNQLFTLNRMNM